VAAALASIGVAAIGVSRLPVELEPPEAATGTRAPAP
jgi:hypothetical protein